MSGNIDEKVVVAKFDNAMFEKNVQQTLTSLDGLKKGMDLSKATKSLGDLDSAGKHFSLAGIATGVDTIAQKFNAMSVVAVTALATITNQAVVLGQKMASGFMQPMQAGFAEYENKMQTVQTMQANTGASMKRINKTLQQMADYANLTVYSFGDMAQNMGLFTAAGVKLEPAMKAIMGIGNLAAMSGSSSQQAATAMYQLSQALASGTVRLMDWNSVQNAGMGGKVFQNALVRTASLHDKTVSGMIKKEGSFRESLKSGWLTSKVLTDTLNQMTGTMSKKQIEAQGYTKKQAKAIWDMGNKAQEAATKVKTFSQLLETISSNNATGWANSWQIVIGDLKEARALFSEMNDKVGKLMSRSTDSRNDQLQTWKDLGGRKAIVDGLRNAFNALMRVVDPIVKAFGEVFPPSLGKNLYALSVGFRNFTAGLVLSKDQSKGVHDAFVGIFSTIKIGVDILSGIGQVVGNGLGKLWDLLSSLGGFVTPVVTFFSSVTAGGNAAADASDGISKFFYFITQMQNGIFEPIIAKLKELAAGFDEFLNKGDLAADFRAKMAPVIAFFDQLRSNVVTDVSTALNGLPGAVSGAWNWIIGAVKNVWDFCTKAGSALKDAFSGIGGALTEGMKHIDLATVLNIINTGLFAAMTIGIIKFAKGFKGFFSGISDAIEGLTKTLSAMQNNLKAGSIMAIAGAILLLAGAVLVLSLVKPENLLASIAALGALFAELLGSMAIFQKIAGDKGIKEMPIISASLVMLAGALRILAGAALILGGMDQDKMVQGLIAVTILLGLLVAAAEALNGLDADFVATAGSMILIAGALAALAGVVAIFAVMPLPALAQGLGAVTAMLALMVGSAVVLSKFAKEMAMSAVGMLAMAAALGLLANVVIVLGLLPLAILQQGFISVGILMALLVGAAVLLSKFAPDMVLSAVGLMAMAAAIGLMVNAVVILGMLPMDKLIQGFIAVAALMAVLVGAAMLMTTALPGAVAMLAVAGSLLILTFAVMLLAAIPMANIVTALFALMGAIIMFAFAAAMLTPVIPSMLALAGGLALMGLAVLAVGAGMMLLAVSTALLGPALQLLAVGLTALGQNLGTMGNAMLVLAGLGVALGIFAVGAALAGGAFIILGMGLLMAAAGLLALGFASIIAVTGLASFVMGVQQVFPLMGNIALLGAALLAFGAGAIVAGIGMILVGTGAMMMAAGLMMLNVAAAGGVESIGLIVGAFTALGWQIPAMLGVGAALVVLGAGALALGAGVLLLGSGVALLGSGMLLLGVGANLAAGAVQMIVDAFGKLAPVKDQAVGVAGSVNTMSGSFTTLSGAIGAADIAISVLQAGMNDISSKVSSTGRSIESATGLFKSFASSVDSSMTTATTKAGTSVDKFVKTVSTKLKDSSKDFKTAGKSVGKAIDDGLVSGMNDHTGPVYSKAREIIRTAINEMKKEADSHSPSKETAKIGGWMSDGLGNGMTDNIKVVERAATGVAGGAISALKKALEQASTLSVSEMDMTPTIRPVLDLSAVKKDANTLSSVLGMPSIPVRDAYSAAASILENRQAAEQAAAVAAEPQVVQQTDVSVTQNNYSPKALTPIEIYRQTNNVVAKLKG